jgi:hypothetical protein
MCIKTYDKRVNDLEIGNTYIIDYDEKSYYPYHLRNFPFLLTDDEIKEYFITIEEWREKRINKILENV